jgi:hypothetical protein
LFGGSAVAILTAGTVILYAPKISASAGTITASGLIPIVQERITLLCNNYFELKDLYLESTATFNATARSITLPSGSYWVNSGFQANDDMLIYNSYRNDSIVTIESLSNETVILTSACSVVDESFNNNTGNMIYFSVIKWPVSVQQVAAQMIFFDYDIRGKTQSNIKSRSLGPLSESFTDGATDERYGYPIKIIEQLNPFIIGRVF